jgi:hypothetical protein
VPLTVKLVGSSQRPVTRNWQSVTGVPAAVVSPVSWVHTRSCKMGSRAWARGALTPTGIGNRRGGKEIAEKPAFKNRESLLLVGGGHEFWHGNPRRADGNLDMFPEIIDMGQETRRDPALLTGRHRLREPTGCQPDGSGEREPLTLNIRVQGDLGRQSTAHQIFELLALGGGRGQRGVG